MSDTSILIKDFSKFIENKHTLRIVLKSSTAFELFPVGFRQNPGPEQDQILIKSDGTGNVVFQFNDQPQTDLLMSLFCFVDGVITISTNDDESKVEIIEANVLDDDGNIIERGARIFGDNVGTNGMLVNVPTQHGRAYATVLVHKPCQISFDFTQDGYTSSNFGIVIAHDHSNADSNGDFVQSVYFDRHKNGVWIPNSRIKLGYFIVKAGEKYKVNFAVVPESCNDEWESTVKVAVTSDGNTKVMRGLSRVSGKDIQKIVARESGSTSGHGSYEIAIE